MAAAGFFLPVLFRCRARLYFPAAVFFPDRLFRRTALVCQHDEKPPHCLVACQYLRQSRVPRILQIRRLDLCHPGTWVCRLLPGLCPASRHQFLYLPVHGLYHRCLPGQNAPGNQHAEFLQLHCLSAPVDCRADRTLQSPGAAARPFPGRHQQAAVDRGYRQDPARDFPETGTGRRMREYR